MKPDTVATSAAMISRTTPLPPPHTLMPFPCFPLPQSVVPSVHLRSLPLLPLRSPPPHKPTMQQRCLPPALRRMAQTLNNPFSFLQPNPQQMLLFKRYIVKSLPLSRFPLAAKQKACLIPDSCLHGDEFLPSFFFFLFCLMAECTIDGAYS